MPTVLVMNGKSNGKWLTVDPDRPLLVGRDQDLRGAIDDDRISRQHFRLVWDAVQQAYVVGDMGSRNGIRLNGRKIRQDRALNDDDVIHVGNTFLVFTTEEFTSDDDADSYLERARLRHSKYLIRLDLHEKKKSGDPLYANVSRRSRSRESKKETNKNRMWLGFKLGDQKDRDQQGDPS